MTQIYNQYADGADYADIADVDYADAEGVLMSRLLACAIVVAIIAPARSQSPATTADLAFLTGCWKFESGGLTIEEHWLAPLGGSLLGVSRTVKGGKTVDHEFLQIRDLPEGTTYIAKPARQAETSFKLVSKRADEIVFENPTHDFPQRIRYRRGADTLHARIEGTKNGKPDGMDFPYARVACIP